MFLLSRFIINGHSMEPTFLNGSAVLGSSIPYFFSKPSVSDIVIFRHKGKMFIKRIKKIEHGKYFIAGDNPSDSLDSKNLGWIERKQIVGKIILKI